MNTLLIFILCLYIIKETFEYWVLYLNLRYMRKFGSAVPPEFEGEVDAGLFKKAQDYEADKARLSIISSLVGNVMIILFMFGGLLNAYNSWIASLNLSFIISGWLFFILLSYAGDILSIPFSLYSTFKIESKYGFNTMTRRLWIADFIKSLMLSTVMMSLLLFAALWLIQRSPDYWWFFVWCFLFAYSIFVMYISPYVIEPLFNKFTPLEDEILKEKITGLTDKVGIHISRILKMNASKRSRHTNAYFTGLGRTKRIVLYDTLLKAMSHEETLAVLAHEIGHWKRRHLLKMLAVLESFSLIAVYISFKLTLGDYLMRLFHISADTIFVKLAILAFLAGIVALPLQPLMNAFIRRHEREADRVSYALTGDAEGMISALKKLSRKNLSNLYPHPLYVTLYYSHPPILERVGDIKGFQGK
ncbi:MAG: M48 family metallopeptidase [Deltaproteobacteria bacterium]|nr:M48 family metallopeptidase [Deltaproteobacteria bacterium]